MRLKDLGYIVQVAFIKFNDELDEVRVTFFR